MSSNALQFIARVSRRLTVLSSCAAFAGALCTMGLAISADAQPAPVNWSRIAHEARRVARRLPSRRKVEAIPVARVRSAAIRAHRAATSLASVSPNDVSAVRSAASELAGSTQTLKEEVQGALSDESSGAPIGCYKQCLDLDNDCRSGSTPATLCDMLFNTCVPAC